jgi:hypothetical protein
MTRLIGLILVVTFVGLGAFAFGRAIDVEAAQRVIFTRDGVTFDCERRFVEAGQPITFEDGSSVHASVDGEVHYTNCHTCRSPWRLPPAE